MGLMDDIFGSNETNQVSGYGPAMDLIDNEILPLLTGIARTGPLLAYNADQVANLTPAQQRALEDAIGFSQGQGRDIADQILGLAQMQAGALPGAIAGLQGIAADGGPAASTMSAETMDAATMSPTTMDAALRAGPDMALVDSLINNDVLDRQIRAATRPIERALMEQALPGISDQFAGASNAGSSRRGVAEGIATRGAIESAQDVAARMRGAAYADALGIGNQVDAANTGALNTAALNNMSAMNAAAARNMGATNTAALNNMSALNSAAARNMAAQNAMADASASRQYGALGTLLNTGAGAGSQLGAAGRAITSNFSNALSAGGALQAQEQREIDALRRIYETNQQAPMQLASFLTNQTLPIAQAFPTTQVTSTPSAFQAGSMIGGAIAGIPGFAPAPMPMPMPFAGNPAATGLNAGGFNVGNINQGIAGAFNAGFPYGG